MVSESFVEVSRGRMTFSPDCSWMAWARRRAKSIRMVASWIGREVVLAGAVKANLSHFIGGFFDMIEAVESRADVLISEAHYWMRWRERGVDELRKGVEWVVRSRKQAKLTFRSSVRPRREQGNAFPSFLLSPFDLSLSPTQSTQFKVDSSQSLTAVQASWATHCYPLPPVETEAPSS